MENELGFIVEQRLFKNSININSESALMHGQEDTRVYQESLK